MIHVPDVQTTVAWYQSIGFSVLNSVADGGEMKVPNRFWVTFAQEAPR